MCVRDVLGSRTCAITLRGEEGRWNDETCLRHDSSPCVTWCLDGDNSVDFLSRCAYFGSRLHIAYRVIYPVTSRKTAMIKTTMNHVLYRAI